MDFATLRHRLGYILRSLGAGPAHEPPDAAVPAITPMVYQLAIVAVGDGDSAAVLAADTLAHLGRRGIGNAPSMEVAAVRALKSLLPTGWLSWPGAAGPAEWLRLGLRREQADRVLSVLGEREPLERIALALHLLYDVRRDDLDAWLGTRGMGEQIVLLASYVGHGLELVPPQLERDECAAVAPDLLDVDEPQLGRRARLHIVGCDVCRRRARGMRETFGILREALLAFFRTPLPQQFGALLRKRELELRYPPISWRPLAAFAAAVLLVLFAQRAARGEQASFAGAPPAPTTAAELIDRAIYRLDADRPPGEVWHETISFASNGERLLLERWYEFSRQARTRIIVKPEAGGEPLLDIASNTRSVAYAIRRGGHAPQYVELRDPDVSAIMPLLRQLPFSGSLGDRLIDQRNLDLTLLGRARAGSSRLLGSTLHNGRPAWMMAADSAEAGKMTLTIDRDTSTLLEVRLSDDGSNTRTRLVWDAVRFEVTNRNKLPPRTFELDGEGSTVSMLNPRQLGYFAPVQIGIDDAEALTLLPLPATLPDEVMFSYVRGQGIGSDGLLAVYESRWSTLEIVHPLAAPNSRPVASSSLDRQFNGGSYTVIEHDATTEGSWPNTTLVEFALDSAPRTRLGLLYWHAFADRAEREAAIQHTLDSLSQAKLGAARLPDRTIAEHRTRIRLTLRVGWATVLR